MEKEFRSSSKHRGILGRNTIINLVAHGIPLLFAVVALPFIIDGLGTARFGVLTIVWIVISYFGFFDMGIGRATTKFVADYEAKGNDDLSPIIITSIVLLVLFGIFWSLLIVFLTPVMVTSILNVPAYLISETKDSFYILSISIPFVLGSTGARGALEAQQEFTIVNAVKVPSRIIHYAGPLLILPFSHHLQPIVILMVVGRILSFLVYTYFSLRKSFTLQLSNYPIFRWAKELLSYGAWITVSSLISPIMVNMDRFIIGTILTMGAVAYYTTPYEVVSRLLVISGAFMAVMFPAFSVFSMEKKDELIAMFLKSIRYLLLVLMPLVTFLIFAANSLLYFWLGNEFAVNSTTVLQLLAAGMLINSIASVPYAALQAGGWPDVTAKLHMVELPLYLLMIWYFTTTIGIVGVALAWVIRVTFDGMLLLYFFDYHISFFKSRLTNMLYSLLSYGTLFLIMGLVFQWMHNRYLVLAYAAVCSLIVFLAFWNFTLNESDRERMYTLYLNTKKQIKD